MIVDWAAVGALATVGAVVIAAMELRSRRREAFLTTSLTTPCVDCVRTEVRGEIPEGIDENSITRTLTAELFKFRNTSNMPIKGFVFQVPVYRPWSAKIRDTKTLAESAFAVEVTDRAVRVSVKDLPIDEVFSLHILSNDYYFNWKRVQLENASASLNMKEG